MRTRTKKGKKGQNRLEQRQAHLHRPRRAVGQRHHGPVSGCARGLGGLSSRSSQWWSWLTLPWLGLCFCIGHLSRCAAAGAAARVAAQGPDGRQRLLADSRSRLDPSAGRRCRVRGVAGRGAPVSTEALFSSRPDPVLSWPCRAAKLLQEAGGFDVVTPTELVSRFTANVRRGQHGGRRAL